MRYCNACHHMTTGEPVFCNFCGRSYDLKLCPHRHPNPRSAEVCSQCGSRELSTPQPRTPRCAWPISVVLSIPPGVALALVTVLFAIAVARAVLDSQQLQLQLIGAGLALGLLWYLYAKLPASLRRFLSRLFSRSNRDDHGR